MMKKFGTFFVGVFMLTSVMASSSFAWKAFLANMKKPDGTTGCFVVYVDPVSGKLMRTYIHDGPCVSRQPLYHKVKDEIKDEVKAIDAADVISKD